VVHLKPLRWIGSSRNDLQELPSAVRRNIGYALQFAQAGTRHPSAKPLRGFEGGVLEVVEDCRGDTFRAVYTVRFKLAIYVLHVFQKKSKTGIVTPRHELELVSQRLRRAAEDYRQFAQMHSEDSHEKP
jgi:phage-related protein